MGIGDSLLSHSLLGDGASATCHISCPVRDSKPSLFSALSEGRFRVLGFRQSVNLSVTVASFFQIPYYVAPAKMRRQERCFVAGDLKGLPALPFFLVG